MEKNSAPLWQPSLSDITASQMTEFRHFVNQHYQQNLDDYSALYHWSITYPTEFWASVWSYSKIIAKQSANQIYIPSSYMPETQWFTGAKLNFAENLLRYRDDHVALISVSEKGQPRTITYAELYHQVITLANWLTQCGVSSLRPNCWLSA